MNYQLLVAVFGLLLVLSIPVHRKLVSPVVLYFTLWVIVLGLVALRLFPYREAHTQTVLAIGLSGVSMFAGGLIPLARRGQPKSEVAGPLCLPSRITLIRLVLGLSFISALGTIARTISIARQFGSLEALMASRLTLRAYVALGLLDYNPISAYVQSLAFVAIPFAVLLAEYHPSTSRLTITFPLLILAINDFILNARTWTVGSLLIYGAAYSIIKFVIKSERVALRTLGQVFLIIIVVAVVFFAYQSLRYRDSSQAIDNLSQDWILNQHSIPFVARDLSVAYLYVTSGIPAFNELVNYTSFHEYWYGWATFAPVCRAAAYLSPLMECPRSIPRSVFIPVQTNIYTLLETFYLDFGLLGIVIYPFVLGFIGTYHCVRLMRAWRLTSYLILTSCVAVILMSTYFNALSITPLAVGLFGAPIVGTLLEMFSPSPTVADRETLGSQGFRDQGPYHISEMSPGKHASRSDPHFPNKPR